MLWGRAAGRCSLPECKLELVSDETETDDPSLVGEVCHIVAENEKGPRGISNLTREDRDKYSNLILMCNVHHKMVDDQPNHFTVQVLHAMKSAHEQFVGSSFDTNSKQVLMNREMVAGYIDHWASKCGLEEWNAWTSYLFSSQSAITKDRLEALETLPHWLLSRVWPSDGFLEIEGAMNNFRRVLNGFLNTFKRYSEPFPDGEDVRGYWTEKFYKIEEWNETLFHKLLRKYESHNALIDDYALELTRAANHICDSIRLELLHSFRLEEGHLLVTSDLDMSLSFTTYKPQYMPSDYPSLYGGEEDFNMKRLVRDVCFGTTEEAQTLDAEYKLRRSFSVD
jgi:hypothetical protein